jgi:predicted ATPase/DNA-binding SARP family transcriptional activator
VDIRLLGTLEVVDDSGAALTVAGAKLRRLLAALAVRPGRVVSADRLVDELWGDDPPAGAGNSLQVLVSKLRRVLPEGTVATRAPGYLLDVAAETVDVWRFAQLAVKGRAALAAGEAETAAGLFGEALGLWRGDALAEFADEEFAQAEIARLREERLAVVEDRVDADLACGRHGELVGELEEAVRSEPLRERRRAQLMLALYRSGRQADALRQFQEARRVLGEELGLDPGPELRRLEAAVLAQDPSLDLPDRPVSRVDPRRRRRNLPAPLTPTIGREDELAGLRAAVIANRLVTVTGPGGVGKTRLAIETARLLQDGFGQGVWLVELARIGGADAVVPAITTTLGVPDLPGTGATGDKELERLADFFSAKDALLVLDNCEHVIAEVAGLAEAVLGACPDLKILATSRENLGVPGETLWPARPLPRDAAVALFAQRASAASPGFALTGDVEATVAEICARVDGLPLAIELAAARVRAFPVPQIATRLDDRFRLLTAGARTALARQQSLRAVVDWSYDLLFDDERRLFERLSVFGGACDVDAAIGVCADERLPAPDVPELLTRLVDKSVLVVACAGREARFSMLQTLAEYGAERLAVAGDAAAVRGRHCHWFAELAGRSYEAFKGTDHAGWVRSVGAEMDNLRAALGWACQSGDAESALVITGGLGWYWQECGRASEGLRWLDQAFACDGEATPGARCHALLWRKVLSRQVGLADPGPGACEVVDIARQVGDAALVAWMQVMLAEVALGQGDIRAAMDLWMQSRTFYAKQGDPFSAWVVAFVDATTALLTGDQDAAERHWTVCVARGRQASSITAEAACCVLLGNLVESRGDYERAAELLRASMRMTAELGFHAREVTLLVRLAGLAGLMGDPDQANALFAEADQVAADAAFRPVLARALSGLAVRHRQAGRLAAAEDAARRALARYHETGFGPGVAGSLCMLGFISELRGEAQAAETLHREALTAARQAADPRSLAHCLEGLAGVALLNQQAARCASMLGAAARLRGAPGVPPTALAQMAGTLRAGGTGILDDLFDARRIEAAARERLGAPGFEAAYAAGAAADAGELTGT